MRARSGALLGGSLAPVLVLKAHDIILAQIPAGLDLDDVQGNLARVLDAMAHSDGNVGGLVLFQQKDLIATRDARGARHNDPVFGAVVMHLQRQHSAWIVPSGA